RVQVNNNATGTVSNNAQARSTETPTPVVSNNVVVSITIPLNVTIQKAVDKTSGAPGDTLQYTISFRNNSAVSISGATITDTLPSGLQFLLSPQSVFPVSNTITWTLPTISPGQQGSVSFQARILQGTPDGTQITNQASFNVAAQQFTVSSAPVTTTVATALNLSVTKTVDQSTAAPGATLRYVIAFQNNGGSTVNGAVIQDQLP